MGPSEHSEEENEIPAIPASPKGPVTDLKSCVKKTPKGTSYTGDDNFGQQRSQESRVCIDSVPIVCFDGKSVKAERATAQRFSCLEQRLEEEMRRCKELEAILEIQMNTRASLASSKSNKSKDARDKQERKSAGAQERKCRDGDSKRSKGDDALGKRLKAEKRLVQEVEAVSKIQHQWREQHPHPETVVIEVNVVPPSKERGRRDRSASRERPRLDTFDDSERDDEEEDRRSRKCRKDKKVKKDKSKKGTDTDRSDRSDTDRSDKKSKKDKKVKKDKSKKGTDTDRSDR